MLSLKGIVDEIGFSYNRELSGTAYRVVWPADLTELQVR